jgi:hypothetical protein
MQESASIEIPEYLNNIIIIYYEGSVQDYCNYIAITKELQ